MSCCSDVMTTENASGRPPGSRGNTARTARPARCRLGAGGVSPPEPITCWWCGPAPKRVPCGGAWAEHRGAPEGRCEKRILTPHLCVVTPKAPVEEARRRLHGHTRSLSLENSRRRGPGPVAPPMGWGI